MISREKNQFEIFEFTKNLSLVHSKPEMSVGYAKMNQANDYQSNLDHQWAYQMPLKTRKSN